MSHPVKLIVGDDLQRTRASVFFRLLLAIPHFVWLLVWGIAVFFLVVANWLITLVKGRSLDGLHQILCEYVRYFVHVQAYVNLLAERYPGFSGHPGYPIDVEFAPPQRQNRWIVGFRVVLVIPALVVYTALTGGGGGSGTSAGASIGLLSTVALLGWFSSLARARMPRGMRDAGAYALSYSAQVLAYVFILTDRYPNSDPYAALEDLPSREDDPIRLDVGDDLKRSRLTVFFRLPLAIPHIVWLALWGIAVAFALIANWFATLFTRRSPEGLHRFLASYLRYQTHVYAFLSLTANPFPGFTGAAGSYPVELVVAPPEQQGRWAVFFRLLLALPAVLLSAAYLGLLTATALLGWFASLVRAQMPLGLRNAGALGLRYSQQANGYLYLLTPVYPYSGPIAARAATEEPAPYVAPDPLATA